MVTSTEAYHDGDDVGTVWICAVAIVFLLRWLGDDGSLCEVVGVVHLPAMNFFVEVEEEDGYRERSRWWPPGLFQRREHRRRSSGEGTTRFEGCDVHGGDVAGETVGSSLT